MKGRLVIPVVAALMLVGCAVRGSPTPATDRYVLTAEDLESISLPWAYETIERLRPHWLRPRGTSSLSYRSASEVVVYLDGMRFGGQDSLRTLRIADMREIRYLSGPEATNRFGTGVTGGVIHVQTK